MGSAEREQQKRRVPRVFVQAASKAPGAYDPRLAEGRLRLRSRVSLGGRGTDDLDTMLPAEHRQLLDVQRCRLRKRQR